MRIFIIGGTNFMGPLVVHSLSEQGHEVTVFHRGQARTNLPRGVKEILDDRHSLDEYAADLQRLAPEVVLDMIPFTEKDALEVMRIFTGIAHRLVAISSQDVYRAFGRAELERVAKGHLEGDLIAENHKGWRGVFDKMKFRCA